jgi:hypothetical protein
MTEQGGGTGEPQPPSVWSAPGWPPPGSSPAGPPPPGQPASGGWPAAPPSYESWQPSWQPPTAPGPSPGWGPAWLGQPRTTNIWAIVALVTGIFAVVPVAIGAGIAALVQIHGRRQAGLGMAIGGLVLAGLWTLVGIGVVIALVIGQTATYGVLGRVADAGSTSVGSCLAAPTYEDSLAAEIDCAEDHDAEVYLVEELGDGAWPGYDDVDVSADEACYDAFEAYVGRSWELSDLDYGYFLPDQGEWAEGEHRVVCAVLPRSEDALRGSVQGSGR